MNQIIQFIFLTNRYVALKGNNKDYIDNLRIEICRFLDLYVESVKNQLLESLLYDLHVMIIDEKNRTEQTCAEILKCIPKNSLDFNFVIVSYGLNPFVSNFLVFSLHKNETHLLINFISNEKISTAFKENLLLLNPRTTYLFILRFIFFFEKCFKFLNRISTKYDRVFIIQPKQSEYYEKNTLIEILRKHESYFSLKLVIMIEKRFTNIIKNRIACLEDSIIDNIQQYVICALEYEFILELIERAKQKIQSISFLYSDLYSVFKRDLNENSKSNVSSKNILNKLNYLKNESVKFRINKYIIIKNHKISTGLQKVKEFVFYCIFIARRYKIDDKIIQVYSLDLFLYTLEIKRSLQFSNLTLNNKIKYDLRIIIKKHINFDPDILMFKIINICDLTRDFYDVKKVLLNLTATSPSEFKEIIKTITNSK
ncbi:hypothetical protein CWI36_0312p0020 [Hamiltosporidium magnivora]|uniref:Uncharacterized protein n=1 Tax=Hamiltosporidium magnivora TaxID=148818 RepID=A0A4V2JWB4_9MICR|nr:hypothetical protein CWI36_0312p0020 [Hamiltosporidium magnivora]